MEKIEVGQEREFIERAHLDGRVIEKGTRVRIGFVTEELLEANVMVIVLGTEPPETLLMARHLLMVHSVPVRKHA